MPLISNSQLPSFERLSQDGFTILNNERAAHQDIRELHIGLLNMMPDSALEATERQYLSLITSCNTIAQFYVHVFTLPSIERDESTQAHIDQYYESFDDIKKQGLDALIITGANPAERNLYEECFWDEMIDVFNWAKENVVSILCSCLASHAAFKLFYQLDRKLLPKKCWGVYSHKIIEKHPLVSNVNTKFDVPHSRHNEICAEELTNLGLNVLVKSNEVGVHLATSSDGFRVIYFQGHPEYSLNSLLKEYKREIIRFYINEREDYPPQPENYFEPEAAPVLAAYEQQVVQAKAKQLNMPELNEDEIMPFIANTWWDSGKAIFNNWLGIVYQLTNVDRQKVFMDGIDPENPLASLQKNNFHR